MTDLKITIDQLKNYLGTELKVTFDGDEYEHELIGIDLSNEGMHLISAFNDFGRASIKNIRPLVYRLSDLDKEVEHNGERFVPAVELSKLITQAGWQGDIDRIDVENNTLTVVFVARYNPITRKIHQPTFEIDIDADFGFGIFEKIWISDYPKRWEEEESVTGNIWKMYQKLFEWHFWPFGDEYFEQGLVIDKMKQT